MSNEENHNYSDEFDRELIRRYEDKLSGHQKLYFDVHEYENIIDFYIENNNYDAAINAVKIAETQHPQASIIRLKNAQILIDEGEPVKSLKILKELERIEAENIDIYLLKAAAYNIIGETREAIKHYDQAILLSGEDKEEVLYNIGVSFESTMHYDLALRYFKEAHKLNPINVSVIYDMAFCYEKLSEFGMAIEYYNKYLDEDSYSELVWYKLGGVYERQTKYAEALYAYDMSIVIEERFSLAYLCKANMLILVGELQKAIEVYLAFLEMENDYLDVYCTVGACFEELGDTTQALNYYNKALSIDNDFSEAYFAKAGLYLRNAKPKLAYSNIKIAVEFVDQAEEYWILYAEITSYLGYNKKANYGYQRAIMLNPENLYYHLSYCEYLYHQEQYEDAIKILERIEHIFSNDPDYYLHYGIYLIMSGNKKEGKRLFKKGSKMLNDNHLEILDRINNLDIPVHVQKILNLN